MANFKSGVKGYIYGKATVHVHFPVDFRNQADISCYQCPFFSRNSCMCQLNKKIVNYPERYVGVDCPLELDEE